MKKIFCSCVFILNALPLKAQKISLEPPPGWKDVTSLRQSSGMEFFLEGPEGSSFVLTRLKPLDTSNLPVITVFLIDVINALNKKTGLLFTPSQKLHQISFENGINAWFLKAKLNHQPRLILAITDLEGTHFLAVLNSAIPDMMLPATLGAIKTSTTDDTPRSETLSADSQLSFTLPSGLISKTLSSFDKNSNIVMSIVGLESHLTITKLDSPETSAPKDEPLFLENQIRSLPSIDPELISQPEILTTPAGPSIIYISAGTKDEGALTQKAMGYLPWCYWGYSISAEGPHAKDLISQVFKTLSPGPSALPRILEKTPKISIPSNYLPDEMTITLASIFLILIGLGIRRLKKIRKNHS